MDTSRVVLHLDLDAFYAQVEHVRLGIPLSTPLCVQQWDGLIAVNYAAKALGIKRFGGLNASDVAKKFPEVRLIHVEVIDESGNVISGASDSGGISRVQGKASLRRYRESSASIFEYLSSVTKHLEKGGLDEAYLDVTELIQGDEYRIVDDCRAIGGHSRLLSQSPELFGAVVEGGHMECCLDLSLEAHRNLWKGAKVAHRIQSELKRRLHLECSIGVSHNKMCSKILSAKHKPFLLSILSREGAATFLPPIPLRKVPGFGAAALKELPGIETCHDLLASPDIDNWLPPDRTQWMRARVQGIDNDPVRERIQARSILSAKSFPLTRDLTQAAAMLRMCAHECFTRFLEEKRPPKSIRISVRHPREREGSHSSFISLPWPKKTSVDAPSFAGKLERDLGTCGFFNEALLPITHVDVTLVGLSAEEEKSAAGPMDTFVRGGGVNRGTGEEDVTILVKKEHAKEKAPPLPTALPKQAIETEKGAECPQCQATFSDCLEVPVEHMDWHLARDLAQEEGTTVPLLLAKALHDSKKEPRERKEKRRESSTSQTQVKKRQRHRESSRPSILNYFTKPPC